MNFLARSLSTRFAAALRPKSSSGTRPELQSKAANTRGTYRIYVLLGLAALLMALLALPAAQIKSSAQGGKSAEVKKHLPRFARAPIKSPNTVLAQPNDICTGAIPISLRQSVDGSLSTATNDYTLGCGVGCFTGVGQTVSTAPGRDVVYSFTAPATASYSFKVTQLTSPSNLVLYTSTTCPAPGVVAATRASNRNATLVSEEVDCQALTAGQQIFIFVDENTVGTSTTFKIEATHCQRETEANNTPATANPFIFGVEGSLNPGGDVDFYSLTPSVAGSRVFALIDGSAGIPQATDDFDLRVTTTTDTLEYDDDNGSSAIGSFSPVIAGRALTGLNSYLRVNAFAGAANEPYRLYAIVEPVGANPIAACVTQTTSAIDETEPNDTPATANTSPAGLGYFEGTLDDVSDFDDFYAINANAGDIIFASLDLDPCRDNTPFDGDLFFVAPDGVTVLVSGIDGDIDSSTTPGAGSLTSTTPESPAEGIVYRVQTSGTYYLVAEQFDGAGDYLLAISRNGNIGTGPTAAGATIRGQVTAGDGSVLSGVSVTLGGAKSAYAITDSTGRYSFTGLNAGDFYSVTPSKANYAFTPASRSISLNSSVADATFTATADSTETANAIDTSAYFIRQHYLDFLDREPDQGGLEYWTSQLAQCGSDAACINSRRIDVSAAYFMSDEFQQTSSFVYGLYKGSLGRNPRFAEFTPDRSQITAGSGLEQSKAALADNWVTRAEFKAQYPDAMSNADFVNKLFDTAGLSGYRTERQNFISAMANGTSRAQVLKGVVESEAFRQKEYNSVFVLTEYFGYLRRDPDEAGLAFWLNVLNSREPNNYRGMVCSFVTSSEYQKRFSSVVTHSNAECGQ